MKIGEFCQILTNWKRAFFKPILRAFLGGGNSNIFYFHPYLGIWFTLTNIFQVGWNHQLDLCWENIGILHRGWTWKSHQLTSHMVWLMRMLEIYFQMTISKITHPETNVIFFQFVMVGSFWAKTFYVLFKFVSWIAKNKKFTIFSQGSFPGFFSWLITWKLRRY